MTLADYLAAAAAAASVAYGSVTYVRQSAEQATLTLNAAALPAIILYDYTTSQVGPQSRVETAALTLYFADARPGDGDSPEAHHAAVARMRTLQGQFLRALHAYPLVQLDNLRDTPFTSAYEAELDGVGLQLTLTVPAVALC